MKPRELFYLLGMKPKAREYGWEVRQQDLGVHGEIQYARWLHPKANDHVVRPSHIDELRKFVRTGDLCVDVGAHCGDTAVPMGIAAGTKGCVVALEPNRYLFPVLKENCRLNADKANIQPVMAAATPEAGVYTFGYTDPGYCNGGDDQKLTWWRRKRLFPLDVQGIRLEEFLREEYADRLAKLRYIKTDTEGNDLDLLKSIRGLLEEFHPYLRIEVYRFSSEEYKEELFDYLSGLGYEVRATHGLDNLYGERLTSQQLREIVQDDIFCLPPASAKSGAKWRIAG